MSYKAYGGADLVEIRAAVLKLDEKERPTRVNMSLHDKRGKIQVFEGTKDANFDENGILVYEKMRRLFFELAEANGIDADLLFNLFQSKIPGMMTRDRFGPYNFGDKELGPNPHGLSMEECEREANQLLWAMIPDPRSPPGVELRAIERQQLPILSFFATYDQLFFDDSSDQSELRDAFRAISFNDIENPKNTFAKMKLMKLT